MIYDLGQGYGKGSQSFVGFNADAITGWSTYASQAAAMGKENGRIGKALSELAKEPQSEDRDAAMTKLSGEKKDIVKVLGFPKAISKCDAEMLKSVMPDMAAQEDIMAAFAAKRVRAEAATKRKHDETL